MSVSTTAICQAPMSSSCLTGGGSAAAARALDIVVKPSSTTSSSHSSHSSPSSTISDSSNNSPLAISTKKSRTPRKRPNEVYNEAAALLSAIYPTVFDAKCLRKLSRHSRPNHDDSAFDISGVDLLFPPPAAPLAGFLLLPEPTLLPEEKPYLPPKPPTPSFSSDEKSSRDFSREPNSTAMENDFDAESILDEEIGEGIDSIMGNLSVNNNSNGEDSPQNYIAQINPYLGFGGRFESGFELNIRRALRRTAAAEDGEWWRSPTVEVVRIVPKLKPAPEKKSKKKKKKVEKVEKLVEKLEKATERDETKAMAAAVLVAEDSGTAATSSTAAHQQGEQSKQVALGLKLNYQDVLKSWSGRGSPFSDAGDSPESPADTITRLSQIDLFPEAASGPGGGSSTGVREASVLRYKEKRRTRLFSKKIRYQIRKANADTRPRMKASGRFVRRPSVAR